MAHERPEDGGGGAEMSKAPEQDTVLTWEERFESALRVIVDGWPHLSSRAALWEIRSFAADVLDRYERERGDEGGRSGDGT